MTTQEDTLVKITLLIITSITALALLIRSLLTGEDIPQGWALLIGSAWGALLGIGELSNRITSKAYKEKSEEKEERGQNKRREGVEEDNGT